MGHPAYTYDAENRITSVTAPGGVVTHYVYGADGKRVEKQTPSSNFFYDYDDDGSLDATYTLSGTTLTATTQDLFLNGEHLGFFWENSNIYRSALDQVGSVRTRVDPSANIVSADRSFPFGEMQTEYLPGMATYGDTEDTIHFTGKERDTESGLDYFGARYYASNMGRFMSPDPSGLSYADPKNPQSFNLYGYSLNNPLTNIDPTGLTCQTNSTDGSVYDDNDGKGCDTAGIAGDGTVIDPKNRESVTVNPPAPGTDLDYDTRVAADQQWLQSRQVQPGPTSTMYLRAIAKATGKIPNVCGVGGAIYFGKGRIGAGFSIDTQNGFQKAAGFNFVDAAGFKANYTIYGGANGNISYVVPTPLEVADVPVGLEVGTTNGNLNSVQSVALSTNSGGLRNATLYMNLSNFADPDCQ